VSGPKRQKAGPESDAGGSTAGGGLWGQVSTFLIAVIIALGIRTFVIEPFRIPSGSMFPTLLIGDHLFVNKFIYGVKIPFTDRRLPGLREPQRGDVIVFTVAKNGGETHPADQRPDLPREEFVKRIVGLPGDHIEFRTDGVHLNGVPMATQRLSESFEDPGGRDLDILEVSVGDRSFQILDDPHTDFRPRVRSVTVPPGRYLVLGDNRDHSKDSRVWGTVRLAEIKGPAFVLYWSWDFNGSWVEVLNPLTWWNAEKRWDRVGNSVR
jgi:signal peptidase I